MNIKQFITGITLWGSKSISRRGLHEFIKAQSANLKPGDKVLSIGSGGSLGDKLASRAKVVGFSLEQMDISPERQPDIVGDICQWQRAGYYDCIFMLEVLEHVTLPHRAVANLHASLKENGKLCLSVPFIFPIHDEPHDFFRYTRYGLMFLLSEFREVRVEERNSWVETLLVLLARSVRADSRAVRLLSPFMVLTALIFYPFAYLLGKVLKAHFMATGYLVCARRGASSR